LYAFLISPMRTTFSAHLIFPYVTFRNKMIFYGGVIAPRPTPNLEDHSLSAVS
jgi:hypothetical protein